MAGDVEVAEVLGLLNREDHRTWRLAGRLGGGRKTGAWLVEDRDGVRAVLKRHSSVTARQDLEGTAALVARARARGWPTPAWLAWGLDTRQRPYVLTGLVAGEHLGALDDGTLDAVLAVLDRQRSLAGPLGTDRTGDARRAVFGDGATWRAALRRLSPEALEAGEAIARRAAPFRDVRLPGADLVHLDFGLHNLLFQNGEVAAVVDLEGAGRGPVAIDVATLLFSVHAGDAAPEPVLTRLAAYAVDRDGAAVTTVCLASALFDWCVFATGGWEPEAVTAYLLKATSLFGRLEAPLPLCHEFLSHNGQWCFPWSCSRVGLRGWIRAETTSNGQIARLVVENDGPMVLPLVRAPGHRAGWPARLRPSPWPGTAATRRR